MYCFEMLVFKPQPSLGFRAVLHQSRSLTSDCFCFIIQALYFFIYLQLSRSGKISLNVPPFHWLCHLSGHWPWHGRHNCARDRSHVRYTTYHILTLPTIFLHCPPYSYTTYHIPTLPTIFLHCLPYSYTA